MLDAIWIQQLPILLPTVQGHRWFSICEMHVIAWLLFPFCVVVPDDDLQPADEALCQQILDQLPISASPPKMQDIPLGIVFLKSFYLKGSNLDASEAELACCIKNVY